jgi:hypothetical protein
MEPAPRPNDHAFAETTHHRWSDRRLRKMEDPAYRDEWYAEQCGGCRFWIALTGVLGSDYGGCVNDRENSPVAIVSFPHPRWGG